jgi:hypothetical protein
MDTYIAALLETLDLKNVPSEIDLVLDGGAFNGAYTIGTLLYIKELENKKHLTVKRLSGCSMGAIFAVGYATGYLDSLITVGRNIARDFKNSQCLHSFMGHIKDWINKHQDKINLCELNERVFITYHDSEVKKQITISHFESHDHLTEVLIRSSFLPFAINGSSRYQNKYFDGFTPGLFHDKARPSIFISTMVPGYFTSSLVIKGENSLDIRRVEGVEQIDGFFRRGKNTKLCSYVDSWSILRKIIFRLRGVIAILFYAIESVCNTFCKYVPEIIRNHYIVDCVLCMVFDLMRDMITSICY